MDVDKIFLSPRVLGADQAALRMGTIPELQGRLGIAPWDAQGGIFAGSGIESAIPVSLFQLRISRDFMIGTLSPSP